MDVDGRGESLAPDELLEPLAGVGNERGDLDRALDDSLLLALDLAAGGLDPAETLRGEMGARGVGAVLT